jgi:hypothetical protein
MYYRVYCPHCSTPDPDPAHGVRAWVSKVVMRYRLFKCHGCGSVFGKKRRSRTVSLFGSSYEDHPPVYFSGQPEMTKFTPEVALEQIALQSSRLLEASLYTSLQQQQTESLLCKTLEVVNRREDVFFAQQQEVLRTQKNLADTIDSLNKVFQKTTNSSLSPFTVISSTEEDDVESDIG